MKSIRNWFRKSVTVTDNNPRTKWLNAPISETLPVYKNNSEYVYACVRAISDEVATLEVELSRKRGSELVKVDNHPLLSLLTRPNPDMSFSELCYNTSSNLHLHGNAYWHILSSSNAPKEIMFLPTSQVTPQIVSSRITNYKYNNGKSQVELSTNSVLHFKLPNPDDPLLGQSPLSALENTLASERQASASHLATFRNQGTPSAIIQVGTNLSPTQQRDLRSDFDQKFTGALNQGKIVILDEEVNYHPISVSPKDLDFLDTRKFNHQTIMSIFRVPESLLGVSSTVNRSTAEALYYTFSKYVIAPIMRRIVEQIDLKLLTRYDNSEQYVLKFKSPIPPDKDQQITTLKEATNNWQTINESREQQGLPRIDGGDELYIQLGRIPINNLASASTVRPESRDG